MYAWFFHKGKQGVQSQELLYDWRSTANQFVLATSSLRLTTSNFIFQHNTCDHNPYVTSSLTRGLFVVYNCSWPSSAQSFSGPSPAGLMITFYCLRFETPPTWRARSPYLYLPGTGWFGYNSRYWVPFPSPPTTRRARVEVFDPASTRERINRILFFHYLCNIWYKMDCTEDTASNSSIAACVFSAAGTCLPRRCLSMLGRSQRPTDRKEIS
jgi:hypothetical protein